MPLRNVGCVLIFEYRGSTTQRAVPERFVIFCDLFGIRHLNG